MKENRKGSNEFSFLSYKYIKSVSFKTNRILFCILFVLYVTIL